MHVTYRVNASRLDQSFLDALKATFQFGAWQGESLVRESQGTPQERNWDDLFT